MAFFVASEFYRDAGNIGLSMNLESSATLLKDSLLKALSKNGPEVSTIAIPEP